MSEKEDIKPLLARLWPLPPDGNPPTDVAPAITTAIELFLQNKVTEAQMAALLMAMHFTGIDRRSDVIAACADAMKKHMAPVDIAGLQEVIKQRALGVGEYRGGLCDIVGTGGDSHNTFNISTTASIIGSTCLLIAKHGNRASTSKSGAADLLGSLGASLHAVDPKTLASIYSQTNYAFLFAPVFHTGMAFVAPVRRQLPWRTVFNLIGPLANPVETAIEARMIGVARRELGPVFADALALGGARKALVVCGAEELDEVSCAGPTYCWRISEDGATEGGSGKIRKDHFTVTPADFGLSVHPLNTVSPGKGPEENAQILRRILKGEMARDDPILEFVLMNAAALFVTSGICDAESSNIGGEIITERGPGGGRWKEGVRRARWAIDSGEALKQWEKFAAITSSLASS